MMKILQVASEFVPFAKTGGLADVAGTLPAELQKLDVEVFCVMPRYRCIDIQKNKLKIEIESIAVPLGTEKVMARVYSRKLTNGTTFYFIDQEDFFDREELYGTPHGDYLDNDKRFIFFQRAVLELLRKLKLKVDVIHCHDWQTGLIPVYLKTIYANDAVLKKVKSIFTIHNLAYQGNFPPDSLPSTGLGWDQFTLERLEFYGKVSFMKAGILDADIVTTVSQRYSEEIQTEEFGCGLHDVLAARSESVVGIVNGIDIKEWNPSKDSDIVKKFGPRSLANKAENKKVLQEENDFAVDSKVPVIGLISRLVDQKGLDILISALPGIVEMGYQFVLLGTGDEKYHHLLRQIGKLHYGKCGVHIVFDSKMAKKIYAGCDMLLVPSYYEPCGLGQMIALRYGTVPVVRETGGLADTISEFDLEAKKGNGFLFQDYSPDALLDSLKRAFDVFKDEAAWAVLLKNAVASDYSWKASAQRYVELYQAMQQKKVKKGS